MAHRSLTSKPKKHPQSIKQPKSNAGRRTTLLPTQVDAILAWLAEGLTEGQIFNRAAEFNPPFKTTTSMVGWYRVTRNIDVDKIRQEQEMAALRTGLALRANRVKALLRLAQRLEDDIELKQRLWMDRTKALPVGGGEYTTVKEIEFMDNLVRELRGVYDDIAKEVGGRARRLEHSGPDGGPVQIEPFDMADWKKKRDERLQEVEETEE